MWLFRPFRLDVDNQRLWRGSESVALMPKPFAVLKYLVERAGRLVTQDELLAAIWPDTHVQPDVLRRYILEVRRALGDEAETPRFIETLPKRGYQFIAAVTESPSMIDSDDVGSKATLVGRESTLKELDGYFQSMLRGQRQVVFVSGEAGIGKTSLLETFQRRIMDSPGIYTVRGQCVEGFAGKEPYYPILEALGQLVRGPARSLTLNALASAAPTWMIQFPALLRTEQQAELQRAVLGATRARMVRELCEALELMTQEVALVFLLEDLHWVDNSTLDVISMAARRRDPAKLLILGTFRPADLILSESPLKMLSQDLVSHRLAHEVILHGIRRADVDEYLAEEFAGEGLPQDFAAMIHRRSEGNPLFITAMLDHLAQTGVLVRTNGSWKLTAPPDRVDPGVPETLKQMLDVQLGHLRDDERRLLKCASVAGQHFTICSVAIMQESTESEVDQKCVALAERQQFLKSCGMCELPNGAFTTSYQFRHSLYREALYRGLSAAQRVNLHRSLAKGLESYESPHSPVLAARIAAHYEEGRDYLPAIRHLMIAAQIASRRYAHRESMAVLEHARGLLPKVGRENRQQLEWELLEKIGDVHYTLGDMAQSIATYDSLAARAAKDGDRAAEADALMRLSHPAGFVDPDRSIAACERAAELGAVIANPALAAQATLLWACWRILVNGWSEEAGRACDQAASFLRQVGRDMSPYGRLLYARVLVYRSEYVRALENAERALQELTGGDSLWAAPGALYTKASALGHLGRLVECEEAITKGFELAKKDNNAEWLGALHYTLFWLRWHTFDVEGMRELSSSIAASGNSGLSVQMQIQLATAQGFADLAAGQSETAKRTFEAVLDQPAPGIPLWRSRMFAHRGLGEAWLALNELANARREADSLTAGVRNSRDSYMAAFAWEFSARLSLTAGAPELARQDIRQALETIAAVDIPVVAWRVHATAWDVYRQTDSAEAEIERARAAAVILRIAKSLEGMRPWHQSFLAAQPIRRVLEAGTVATASS